MNNPIRLTVTALLLAASDLSAATLYVSLGSTNPTPPYATWATAATNIQDAVDAAAAGVEVVVASGVYRTGGRAVGTSVLTNRVAVDKPLTLRSVNGPQVTVIQGYQVPGTTSGDGAIRCVYLADGASLSGFTLTNGATLTGSTGDPDQGGGGGVLCASTNVWISNCVLARNSASWFGGGAFSGTLSNCTLVGNSCSYDGGGAFNSVLKQCILTSNSCSLYGGGASDCTLANCRLTGNSADGGGGADYCALENSVLTGNLASRGGGAHLGTLNNCTLTDNRASVSGGGVDSATLDNCVVYYNPLVGGGNWNASTFNYCCTTPLASGGEGNISDEPQLASDSHISAASPCRGAGRALYASGTDIDGEAWANPPSMGCDEYYGGTARGTLSPSAQAAYTNVATGVSVGLKARILGECTASRWEFGDGTVVSNQPYTTHTWSTVGNYVVVLRAYNDDNPGGVTATTSVQVVTPPVFYVVSGNPRAVTPFDTWEKAAATIQDAVDSATIPGSLVLVSNGVYKTGGYAVPDIVLNRAAITKPMIVQSLNGPKATTIGGQVYGGAPARCAYLAEGAVLSGFTLSGGWTWGYGCGGAVRCESFLAVVTNCVLATNWTGTAFGGGAYSGTLVDCTLLGNTNYKNGGGAFLSTLKHCILAGNYSWWGGGADTATLSDCILTNNSAFGGGAASSCTLSRCLLSGNSASEGGGAYMSVVDHSTFSGNSAAFGGGACGSVLNGCLLFAGSATNYGGGASGCALTNCTLAGNSADMGGGADAATLWNCTLTNNTAFSSGGGSHDCGLYNCLVASNYALIDGGGDLRGTLVNCTLVGNAISAFGLGGGACNSTLTNCIVYYNTGLSDPEYYSGQLDHCCTLPLPPSGFGNLTSPPAFVDLVGGDFHLQPNSPCVNAGCNSAAPGGTDLDGNPRIVGGTVDMGAYEFQNPASIISYAWLQQYGLPADGSADYADADHDGMNNWQEWVCGTCPTNALSALRLLSAAPAGTNAAVTWQSIVGVSYFLERSTNLASPFTLLATNILGQAGTTTYTDTNATGAGPLFYRVGVRCP